MATGILGISLSGLTAAQASIRTTQNNIANVNTEGYHRQETLQSNATPNLLGNAFYGNGVDVDGVSRSYDRFLENELMLSQTQLSRYDVYSGYAAQVDRLMGDPYTGLSSSFSSFFAAVNEVANDPTSVSARQTMLSAGNTLAGRVNSMDASLEGMQRSVDQQMKAIAGQVTTYAQQVAELSDQISALEGATGQVANDLRDRREQITSEINKLINVTSFTQDDGTYSLYIGSGQPLVVGNRANVLTTMDDPANPGRQIPALQINSGVTPLGSDLITGGQLGGLLSFREDVLNPAQTGLAELVWEFATAFNDIHDDGYDLLGVTGVDFFADPSTYTADRVAYLGAMRVVITDASEIAAAATDAPGDNANALALAALQTAPQAIFNNATFQGEYNRQVSAVASQANAADANQKTYEILTRQAYDAQQSVSGVNLDEEAANLIRFQQAYQAAAKAMQIASSLFDEILAIAR
jgi:flagellar hook-associated protein 1 FlgK